MSGITRLSGVSRFPLNKQCGIPKSASRLPEAALVTGIAKSGETKKKEERGVLNDNDGASSCLK